MTVRATHESGTTPPDRTGWWTRPERTGDLARAAAMAHDPDADRMARYLDARRRGTDFLLSRQRPDGCIGDPERGFDYYRGPWTMGLVGETRAAHAVCDFIRRNLLTPDGRIDGPLRRIRTDWSYRDATLIVGAHHLGEYDLSLGVLPELLRWQDPISGGFSNDREADGGMSDTMDVPYACGGGFAALAVGRMDVALRVATFLRAIWEAQTMDPATDLPGIFDCVWSRSRQRTYRPGDAGYDPDMAVDNAADRMQRWTVGGIGAGFLSRLWFATGDRQWLDLARRYQAFSMAATDAQFRYPSACKSSWGSSLLYQATGEAAYRDWTMRLGDWYVALQGEDGAWRPWLERHPNDRVWITLEYVMHLDTIVGALASRA